MRAGGIAFASLATYFANAQVIITTKNECWKGEGGKFVDNCDDVYFLTYDNYIINAGESCNVFVFSDSRVTWIPEDVTANFWSYYYQPNEDDEAAVTGDDFGETKDAGKKCYPANEVPTVYDNGKVNNYTDGMCGYKY